MKPKLVSSVLIVACVIAGAWWWLRSGPAPQPAAPPPRAQQVITEQEVNAEPARPAGAIEAPANPIVAAVSVAAPDPQAELHIAVQEMLQTLKNQGFPAFADKYVDFNFPLPDVGEIQIFSPSDQLDPSLKGMGFGDLSQLMAELESMQNMVPKYVPSRVIPIEPDLVKGPIMSTALACYDLPPYPGGPKQFWLQYQHGKWIIQADVGDVW